MKGHAAGLAHRVLPDLTEHIAADIHRGALAKGTPTAPTSGSVQAPMAGRVRARVKAEDEARRVGTTPPADPASRLR